MQGVLHRTMASGVYSNEIQFFNPCYNCRFLSILIIYEHLCTVQQKILLQVEFLDCFVLFVIFTIYSTFVCKNAFHDPLELMYVTLAFQKRCDFA